MSPLGTCSALLPFFWAAPGPFSMAGRLGAKKKLFSISHLLSALVHTQPTLGRLSHVFSIPKVESPTRL